MSTHRALSIRLPADVYFEVAGLAQADQQNLNAKFNQLILIGLGRHVSIDAALRRLITTASIDGEG